MINNLMLHVIEFLGNDSKRINHTIKVHSFARIIAEGENLSGEDKHVLEMASILHDIGIHEAERKYNSSAGKYQEIEGPPIAKKILEELNVQFDKIERVCYLVGNHHSYQKIEGIDFQILVEADFLVNICEDEIGKKSILSIREKYFKTDTGLQIINSIYLS